MMDNKGTLILILTRAATAQKVGEAAARRVTVTAPKS